MCLFYRKKCNLLNLACLRLACLRLACLRLACLRLACLRLACLRLACLRFACLSGIRFESVTLIVFELTDGNSIYEDIPIKVLTMITIWAGIKHTHKGSTCEELDINIALQVGPKYLNSFDSSDYNQRSLIVPAFASLYQDFPLFLSTSDSARHYSTKLLSETKKMMKQYHYQLFVHN